MWNADKSIWLILFYSRNCGKVDTRRVSERVSIIFAFNSCSERNARVWGINQFCATILQSSFDRARKNRDSDDKRNENKVRSVLTIRRVTPRKVVLSRFPIDYSDGGFACLPSKYPVISKVSIDSPVSRFRRPRGIYRHRNPRPR